MDDIELTESLKAEARVEVAGAVDSTGQPLLLLASADVRQPSGVDEWVEGGSTTPEVTVAVELALTGVSADCGLSLGLGPLTQPFASLGGGRRDPE